MDNVTTDYEQGMKRAFQSGETIKEAVNAKLNDKEYDENNFGVAVQVLERLLAYHSPKEFLASYLDGLLDSQVFSSMINLPKINKDTSHTDFERVVKLTMGVVHSLGLDTVRNDVIVNDKQAVCLQVVKKQSSWIK